MKKRLKLIFLIVSVFAIILLASSALADFQDFFPELQNELVGQKIPSQLGFLFGNSNINIYLVTKEGNEIILGLKTENNTVANFEMITLDNPDLNVYVTENSLEKIFLSGDPGAELDKYVREKKISWRGVGFFNKIKYGSLSLLLKVKNTFIGGK